MEQSRVDMQMLLEREDEMRGFFSPGPLSASPPQSPYDLQATRSPYTTPSRGYGGSSVSSTFSRADSVSSAASSINSTPLWHAQNLQAAAIQPSHGYNLPCEFEGCWVTFAPDNLEAWISHSISHFMGQQLPLKSLCTFCDDVRFKSNGSERSRNWAWRQRMRHIRVHIRDLRPIESSGPRPDYFLIDHLRDIKLISREKHASLTAYSERPRCDGLVPVGSKVPKSGRHKSRQGEQHDLERERRQMKKEKEKGNEKETHKSSYYR